MVELDRLIELFYDDPKQLGCFAEVPRDQVPQPFEQLLVHEHHMTVTVEKFHESLVDVLVLNKKIDEKFYSREILLTRQSDKKVVQYGIVRLRTSYLDPTVRDEIISEKIPLGRVLINHNVLRRIHLQAVWDVDPGPVLQKHFGPDPPQVVYGRTAIIYCDDEPAIELLEIVTPD